MHEGAAQGGDAVDGGDAEGPGQPHRRDVVGEQPHKAVETRGQRRIVEPAPAGVAVQHRLGADVFAEAQGLDQHLGEGRRVLQPHVEALTRDRMHGMGRVADQRRARGSQLFGQLQGQRIDKARSHHRDILKEVAEPPHQMGLEGLVRRRPQGIAPARRFRPDETGAPLGQGQDGEGAGRQEILMGDIAVVPAEGHGRHNPALRIAPADRLYSGGLSHRRGPALGPDDQGSLNRGTIGQGHA